MFVDIGAGILLAIFAADEFRVPLTWSFVLFGVFSALFPDLDILTRFLPEKSFMRRIIGEHRGLLHRPAFYILLFPLFFLISFPVGILFTLGIVYHLVHDTFFLGWGIKWLWPLSQGSLSIFHDRAGRFVAKVLWWQPAEEAAIKAEYRTEDWIRTFYFKPSLISLTEYPILIIAVVLLGVRMF